MNVVLYKRIDERVLFFKKADLTVNSETTREDTGIYKKRRKKGETNSPYNCFWRSLHESPFGAV